MGDLGDHCRLQLAGTDHPLLVVRPLLDLPKSQLEEACREAGLTWADDPTNRDTAYLRNHIRALLAQTCQQSAASPKPPSLTQQPPVPVPASLAQTDATVDARAAPLQFWQLVCGAQVASNQSSSARNQLTQANKRQPATADCRELPHRAQGTLQTQTVQPNLMAAVLQVQQRCAAAHELVAAQAKVLLQSSLQQRPVLAQSGNAQRSVVLAQSGNEPGPLCCLAVQPFAQAKPAVALHALSAALQVQNMLSILARHLATLQLLQLASLRHLWLSVTQ